MRCSIVGISKFAKLSLTQITLTKTVLAIIEMAKIALAKTKLAHGIIVMAKIALAKTEIAIAVAELSCQCSFLVFVQFCQIFQGGKNSKY